MLAARFYAPRDVRVEDVEKPVPRKGELVIRVLASNMCGTDLKTFVRGHPLMRPPITMGHEYCGVVTALGDDVRKFKRGDRVVASNSAPCGECQFCKRGAMTLCEKIPQTLIGFSRPGSYAQYLRIPSEIVSRNTYRAPVTISSEEIACAEPLAAAIHALDKVKFRRGMNVVVIGTGALGLMLMQLLKARYARVAMTNRSEGRLRVAERLGADEVIQAEGSDLVGKVRKHWSIGPDLVIEAVGKKDTWEDAFRIVRDGGQVLFFGGCAAGTIVSFDAEKMHYGEVSTFGSFHHEPSAFKRAIRAIATREVKVAPLLTHRLQIREIREGFELMERREALKVTVMP